MSSTPHDYIQGVATQGTLFLLESPMLFLCYDSRACSRLLLAAYSGGGAFADAKLRGKAFQQNNEHITELDSKRSVCSRAQLPFVCIDRLFLWQQFQR